jgi:hypothetical protein
MCLDLSKERPPHGTPPSDPPPLAPSDPPSSGCATCLDLSKERERVLFNDPSPHDGFLLNVDVRATATGLLPA